MVLPTRQGLLIICVILAVGLSLIADYKYALPVLNANTQIFYQEQTPAIAANNNTTTNASKSVRPSPDYCPKAVRLNQGLFRLDQQQQQQKTSIGNIKHDFSDVVLLTAANWGYLDVLQNWEFLSKRLGLQWAVLAMDEEIFNALGDSRAVATANASQYSVSASVLYRSNGFNKLSCNKLRSVLHILEACQIDVVFSDCDNVFFRSPFDHDLGKMMQSRQFDYIYQANENTDRPRGHSCLSNATIAKQGNTGFYYISHKNEVILQVMRDTLVACEKPDNAFDDQELFWNTMHSHKQMMNSSMHHCDAEQVDAVTTTMTTAGTGDTPSTGDGGSMEHTGVRLCCLDTYYYPVGETTPQDPNQTLISFHANYVFGKKKKIKKLKLVKSGKINAWSTARTNVSLYNDKK